MTYLTAAETAGKFDALKEVQLVIANGGPSVWGQFRQLLRMALSPKKFEARDYYKYALYRHAGNAQALGEYLSSPRTLAFNTGLHRDPDETARKLVNDKLATELFLREKGIPTTRTLALFSLTNCPDGVLHLGDRQALHSYLSDPANYPLFCKPRESSHSIGAARLDGIEPATGKVTFGTGVVGELDALVDEIVGTWGAGYLFQEVARNHPVIQRVVGNPTATFRVVTVQSEDGPRHFYSAHKLPSPTAMFDAISKNKRAIGSLDPATGRFAVVRHLPAKGGAPLTHWRDIPEPLSEITFPFVQEGIDLAIRAHALLPRLGIIGADVYLTEDGPILNELNGNPDHIVYQTVNDRGILNPDMTPLIEETRRYMQARFGNS
ncbi:hypothetical protein EU803_14670 [Loktanella sp. IMCC34160]|uniref:sugar-transfer associated ATP-grasp domain-containing protein n=1 Tax=Loktanella sp. IMCC34160 TaxID=2510646 RepID=UPI00101C988D|nr:sugar-transfer associated ATP-grasp domain-containing protein [Loktanella sp. IMCC34160]RYG90462.1 hypothetical protein EU803_14670 [Loktanella sp. IMCC34160]